MTKIKYNPIPITDNLTSDTERIGVALNATRLLGDIVYNKLYDNPKEKVNS